MMIKAMGNYHTNMQQYECNSISPFLLFPPLIVDRIRPNNPTDATNKTPSNHIADDVSLPHPSFFPHIIVSTATSGGINGMVPAGITAIIAATACPFSPNTITQWKRILPKRHGRAAGDFKQAHRRFLVSGCTVTMAMMLLPRPSSMLILGLRGISFRITRPEPTWHSTARSSSSITPYIPRFGLLGFPGSKNPQLFIAATPGAQDFGKRIGRRHEEECEG